MLNGPSLESRNPSVGAIALRPQLRAEIALASIREDGEHSFTVAEFGGNKAAGVKNRSRGDSANDPLEFCKTPRTSARIVKRNRDEAIDHRCVEDFGDETGADTLNFVRPRLPT